MLGCVNEECGVKGQVKFAIKQTTKAQSGNREIALTPFFNLGAIWKVSG
jgi:hypothetical protein